MQRILLTFFFALQLSGMLVQAQSILYVSPNGTGDGSSWAQASSLQEAVDNASAGDELRLRQGTYNVSTTISFNKRLEILGGFSGSGDQRDPSLYPSIIDGQGSVHMIQTGSGSSNTLFDGISFINGYANTGADVDDIKGGALYISGNGTRINNCIFRDNTSENRIGSGAIYLWIADDVVIDGCVFENNRVIQNTGGEGNIGGGAIHVRFGSNTRILNTTFRNNYSRYAGGAVHDWGDNTVFENCVFDGNESEEDGGAVYINGDNTVFGNCVFEGNESEENGGAVYVRNDYTHITNCIFIGNRGTDGGGVASNFGGVEISVSYFEGNQAQGRGGAIYNHRFASPSAIERTRFSTNTADLGGAIYNFSEEGLKIIGSLFEANQATDEGGAIFNNRFIEIANTTLVANINTALVHNRFQTTAYNRYQTTVYNSIFYLNTAKSSSYLADIAPSEGGVDASDKDVRNNIVQEFSGGSNNQVGVDPQFVNAVGGDYRLSESSPAINAGDESLYNDVSDIDASSSTDLDDNPRLFGAAIDMGAYELQDEPIEIIPNCTAITAPLDGATDVSPLLTIQWDAVANATGYLLTIGTTATGVEVLDNEDVGDVTSYTLTTELEENTVYYIRVVPYNNVGPAENCSEISFTTETLLTVPDCAINIKPTDNATDVPMDADITWDAMDDVDGYYVSIGTTPGGTDILDSEEVLGTSYSLPADFEENTTYYVRVVPFNAAGEATGCAEISFTTEAEEPSPPVVPECTAITAPVDGATDVALGADITWAVVDDAEGYRVYIGTAAGGTDVVDGEEVTGTVFTLVEGWEENTTYHVRVIPFNTAGAAMGCAETSFTTEAEDPPPLAAPECTTVTAPADGATDVALDAGITWAVVDDADGYRVYIGTTAGGTDVVDGEEVTDTAFTLVDGWDENTTYYVRVIPFNAAGDATGCAEVSFTTEAEEPPPPIVPECTTITAPTTGATDVALDAGITWTAVDDAEGYRVYIGTTAGGTEVVDSEEVTGTAFILAGGWDENTTYHVRVIPSNAAGDATGCAEISFTTEAEEPPPLIVPECTTITAPANGATDVALDAGITWIAVDNADGYRVYIGTTADGTDVVDGEEVTGTAFTPAGGWEENTTYYVRVVPFNAAGEAEECAELSFTTEAEEPPPLIVPECATITAPANGATDVALDAGITWAGVDNAEGYRVYIGTAAGGTDVVDGEEVTSTAFTLVDGWEENTTYHVRVIPFNAAGAATGCAETSFTTEAEEPPLPAAPDCTEIIRPQDGASSISLNDGIAWVAVDGADGYRVSIGTTSGGSELVDNQEVIGTTFHPMTDFEENIPYYIRVIPFNAGGEAVGCNQFRFIIIPDARIQRTKYGISPNDDGINDFWEIDGIEQYPDNTVSLYNRWGDRVFQLKNYDNQSRVFNGHANQLTRFGGGLLPSGTYFFTIEYQDNHVSKKVEGMLVIKR